MGRSYIYSYPWARYPALRLAVLFIVGILSAELPLRGLLRFIMAILCLLGLIYSELIHKKKNTFRASLLSTACYLLLVLSTAGILTEKAKSRVQGPGERLLQLYAWEEVEVSGEIRAISYNRQGKIRLDLVVDTLSTASGLMLSETFRARVLWEPPERPGLGDHVLFMGTVIPVSAPRNPSGFDYRKYLDQRNIRLQLRADSLVGVTPPTSKWTWLSIRKKALSITETIFATDNQALAKALLLGYKNELEADTRSAFSRAGLSHIMAVSGLHVGFVLAPFWILMSYLGSGKRMHIAALGLLAIVLFIYGGITGYPASVVRASVTALLLAYGKLFSQRADPVNLTAAAALIILLFNPLQLYDIGFQLSFTAVLMILMIFPVVRQQLPESIRYRWYGTPITIMLISLIVQLGLYPLQVWYFGEVSLISPLSNALFVPALGLIIPLSLVALLIGGISLPLGSLLAYTADLFLGFMNQAVHLFAGQDWAWKEAHISSPVFFLFWFTMVCYISSLRVEALRWKMLGFTLLMFVLYQGETTLNTIQTAKLELVVLDVGQGDGILIRSPQGKHLLIDTGTWSPGRNSGAEVILPYLEHKGIKHLDAVILSHPHADHIGGISAVMEKLSIGAIYHSGFNYDSELYRSYQQQAVTKGIQLQAVKAGDSLGIDPSILILVFGPEPGIRGSDPNEHSVIVQIIYGNTRFLFTGDAGLEQEKRLLDNYADLLDSDWLKVGHHGSRTSSGSSFLEVVSPDYSVISLGETNSFGHPHPEALQRLMKSETHISFTALDKALIFESDGTGIIRKAWQK